MVDMFVDVSEVDAFGAKMASVTLGNELAKAVNASAVRGVGLAAGFAPVDTGALRGNIRILKSASAGGLTAEYGTDLVYSFMREYGGTITARNAPYLVFQIGGRWVRVKSVTQTGTRYMGRSRDALEPLFRQALADALQRALAQV